MTTQSSVLERRRREAAEARKRLNEVCLNLTVNLENLFLFRNFQTTKIHCN
jgi:hypothetical protein